MDWKAPRWAMHWRSQDLDEITARFAATGSHSRQLIGRGPLQFGVSMVTLPRVTAGWGEINVGQRLRAVTNAPLLHLPLSTPLTYRIGRRHLEARPGEAVFLAAGTAYELAYGPGRWFAIQFVTDRLETRLGALGSAFRLGETLRSREVAATSKDFAALKRVLGGQDAPRPDRRRRERIEEDLTDWMAGILLADLPDSTAGLAAASRLVHLEDWIDEHLAEPLRLGQLCEAAGIDRRGLQKSFLKRRGTSPMQWVRDRRLVAARLRLLGAGPEDTVTGIALRCGFAQLGRFSIAYRNRYGEPPRETLRATLVR